MHLIYFPLYLTQVNFSKHEEQWWELQLLRTSEPSLANVLSGGPRRFWACSAPCWPSLEHPPHWPRRPFSEHPTPGYFLSSSILRQQSICPSEYGDHGDPEMAFFSFNFSLFVMKRDAKLFFISGFNSTIFLFLLNTQIQLSVYWSSKNHFLHSKRIQHVLSLWGSDCDSWTFFLIPWTISAVGTRHN